MNNTQLTDYQRQPIQPSSSLPTQPEKQIFFNRTNKSKSQHALQKIISTSPLKKLQSKENVVTNSLEQQNNDIINIKELINEQNMLIANKNKYYLQQITKIRQNFEMKAVIRNKMKKERKPSSSSQELYEQCWDATLQEINQETSTYKKKQKPLRTKVLCHIKQLFHRILEQENSFFKQKSESLLKLMKKATIKIVDDVNSQIELATLAEKERQQQRSKEREEGIKDIIKSFRFKEQGKLVKLLKSSKRYPDQNDSINSNLSKLRSSSFVLPQISQKTEKDQMSHKILENNQIKEKVLQITRFARKNVSTKSVTKSGQLLSKQTFGQISLG